MDFEIARKRMVKQLIARGIRDGRVIEAMQKIPRHLFVEEAMAAQAYSDSSLPIGEKQTISQPYTVALMTELLQLQGTEKILELGTGSGYQAAILATLGGRVYTVERLRPLGLRARKVLDSIGLYNVNIRMGDGTIGWPEEAPFDAIVVTAGAPEIPPQLLEQMNIGGRLVIPVGTQSEQTLVRVTRTGEGEYAREDVEQCRFVKLVGKQGWTDDGRDSVHFKN
jgi:protein-L-isoaspartate(D-aspartate) O-methyltransferase